MSTDPTVTANPRTRVSGSPSAKLTAILALTVLTLAPLSSGCGSDSDEPNEPFEAYAGLWKFSADTSQNKSQLTCPTLDYDEPFRLFTPVNLVPGTLSDLFETAGPGDCQFAFDVVPGINALSIVTPDPFTGVAPQCVIDLGTDEDETVNTLLFITPTEWDFNLQPSVKGKAPAAQLVGKAQLDVDLIDITVKPSELIRTSPCNYNVIANLEKASQP